MNRRPIGLPSLLASLCLSAILGAQCPGGYGGGGSRGGSGGGSDGGGGTNAGGGYRGPNDISPSGPSTPGPGRGTPEGGPSGPSTPGPGQPGGPISGPSTGGPSNPLPVPPARSGGVSGGPAAPTTGAPMTFERGETSQERLEIAWDYPVAESDGQTMPFVRAIREIRGDDPRPLLVLRECHACLGSDWGLLQRDANNEKTLLMSRWFHCVKLPNDVLDPSHPHHALFHGSRPPHALIVSWDGRTKVELPGIHSQSVLWSGMFRILDAEYRKDARAAVSLIAGLLEQYDVVDSKRATLRARLDRELEMHGRDSDGHEQLAERLAELDAEHAKLRERERRLSDLELKADDRPPMPVLVD